MNDALLKAGLMASLLGGLDSKKPLTAEETKNLRGKISGLEIGDMLRYLGTGGVKILNKGDIVVVASLDIPAIQQEPGTPTRRYDFTTFFRDSDGELMECAFDSCHFERA